MSVNQDPESLKANERHPDKITSIYGPKSEYVTHHVCCFTEINYFADDKDMVLR